MSPRLILTLAFVASGCATIQEPSAPEARAYSERSVTRANPGGDAEHPVDAALERLLTEPIGPRQDFWKTLDLALPDKGLWKGTRFKRLPTRAAYQYGEGYVAVTIVLYAEARGADGPLACLRPLVAKGDEAATAYDVELGQIDRETRTRNGKEMDVLRTSAKFNSLLRQGEYVGAVVSHQTFPGRCLVQAFTAKVGSDRKLAERVVTRWLDDAAPHLAWRQSRHTSNEQPEVQDR